MKLDQDVYVICCVSTMFYNYFTFVAFLTQCGGTTHILRLSWSPDGAYVVSAHAMNNRGPTAQIIDREGWKANMDFVGHRKAVTCVVSGKHHFLFWQFDG